MGAPQGDAIDEALVRVEHALRDAGGLVARGGTVEGRALLLRALRDASAALRRARELAERPDEPKTLIGRDGRTFHDLRSPLTAILGWVQLVRGKGFERETTVQAMDTIERNAAMLARMIDRLAADRRRPAA